MGNSKIHVLEKKDREKGCNEEKNTAADEYKASYLALFTATSKALEALEAQNYGIAKNLLIGGQQKAEELFLQAAESEM